MPISDAIFAVDCDNTGATDVTADIQDVIDACKAAGGGTILLPAGTYLVNDGLVIDFSCAFEGQPVQLWKGNGHLGLHGEYGTYMLQTTTDASVITVDEFANGAQIRNLCFIQQHDADALEWMPTDYPPVILNVTGGTLIEDIVLYGVNKGIQLGRASPEAGSGFVTMRRIMGAAFTWCIHIYKAGDFTTVTDCSFHGWTVDNNVNQRQYIQTHSIVYYSGRNDSPFINNLAAFGFYQGIRVYVNNAFPPGEGTTTRFSFNNIYFDKAAIGMHFGRGALGVGSNIHLIGTAELNNGSYGLQGDAGARLRFTNVWTHGHNVSAILAAEEGADIAIANLTIDLPNVDNAGHPAVYAATGATVTVSGRVQVVGTSGPNTGGGGTFQGSQTL